MASSSLFKLIATCKRVYLIFSPILLFSVMVQEDSRLHEKELRISGEERLNLNGEVKMLRNLCMMLFVFFGGIQYVFAAVDAPVDRDLEISARRSVRSCVVYLHNNSNTNLERSENRLGHGAWTRTPPDIINAGQWVAWASESNGFMTGTEGSVRYRGGDGGYVSIVWDNPFIGSNKFDSSHGDGRNIRMSGGGGDISVIRFYFS